MIIGIGVDVCQIDRYAAAEQRRPGFSARWLTPAEVALPLSSRAARFAAKEALAKALLSEGGLRWHDAEVTKDEHGRPSFLISGTVAARAAELGVDRIHLSISHDAGIAAAYVICERLDS